MTILHSRSMPSHRANRTDHIAFGEPLRWLSLGLRDFRRGGAELPDEKKARFMAIRERLSQLSSRFGDNLLDATNAFAHYVTAESELAGIPEDVGRSGNAAFVIVPVRPDDDRVAADRNAVAEVIVRRTVAGGELGDLRPA